MQGLILTTTELTHCMDLGYKDMEDDEARFPVRLSAIGRCPRATRALLDGRKRRDLSARSLRIFEQGHDRGARLAVALKAGIFRHLKSIHPDLDDRQLSKRFSFETEVEVWCPIPSISGERAQEIVSRAISWQQLHDVDKPMEVSVAIDENGVLMVRGRIDVLIIDRESSELWVLDFKTKASWGFKKLSEEGNGYGYVMQVLAYIRGLGYEIPELKCQGGFLYYEDHDKRNHRVLLVDREDDPELDEALLRTAHLLRNWVTGGPVDEMAPMYAERDKWTKKKHVDAVGCLPWPCNYCPVGPIVGECINTEKFRLEDIRRPGDDVPKYEVYDA